MFNLEVLFEDTLRNNIRADALLYYVGTYMIRVDRLKWYLLVLISFLVLACAESLNLNQNKNQILQASWDETAKIFLVSGTASNTEKITIVDEATRSNVASTSVDAKNSWKISLYNPASVPCSVRAVNDLKSVQNAPANCSTSRVAPVSVLIGDNQIVSRVLPDSTIVTPAEDKTIVAGTSLDFAGLSSVSGATYLWSFSGAAADINVQNPGSVTFNDIGSFRVKLVTTDVHGFADPTPAERLITVLPNVAQKRALNLKGIPVATIATPVLDRNIAVGESIFFAATSAPVGETYSYEWDFGGAAPASTKQVPGVVTFDVAGSYTISLNVTDSAGVRSTLAATRTVTVSNPGSVNQAPTGSIREPLTDLSITTGESVNFLGAVIDPDNNGPFTFLWEFNGAAPDSDLINPGMVTFAQAGVYAVTFTATDAAGLADPNPPARIITVVDSAPVNNDLPESTILTPAGDVTISKGDVVEFSGEGVSPVGNDPVTYLWDFGGAAASSDLAVPGAITFVEAGEFHVTLTAIDSLNQLDPTPAMVLVTVVDPDAPVGTIVLPTGDMTIAAGDTISFSAEATSPTGAAIAVYSWDFGNAIPSTSTDQNTGPVLFEQPGEYDVKLTVVDANGVADPTPATIKITVNAPGPVEPPPAAGDAPVGVIVTPQGNVSIAAGQSVEFNGSATGLAPLTYLWTFDGAAADFDGASPGAVTFTTPGVYGVTLTVTDANGVSDPNPPSVLVTVTAVDAPTGVILSPLADVTIRQGEALVFAGSGSSPSGAEPLTYLWDFADGAPFSILQIPGPVFFQNAGVFKVTLRVFDANRVPDPTPPSIVVTVEPPLQQPPTNGGPGSGANPGGVPVTPPVNTTFPPDGEIVSPKGRSITIGVGDSLEFIGAVDTLTPELFTYEWDFDGAIPNVNSLSPGFVTFESEGVYTVRFKVIDQNGVSDPRPAKVEIVVVASTPPAP